MCSGIVSAAREFRSQKFDKVLQTYSTLGLLFLDTLAIIGVLHLLFAHIVLGLCEDLVGIYPPP